MQVDFKVVLDACVLAPANLCDVFLSLAETRRLYLPVWTHTILDEVQRTQTGRLKWPADLSAYWRLEVEKNFPEALVTDYETLIPICTNQDKDRHVLASAIKAKAEMIVTMNVRDFPENALKSWDVTVCHPGDYLITLYTMNEGVVVSKLDAIARRRNRTLEETLARLKSTVPQFAEHVSESLGMDLPDID